MGNEKRPHKRNIPREGRSKATSLHLWEPCRYLADLLPSAVPAEEQPSFGIKGQEGSSVTHIPAHDGGKGRVHPLSPFPTSPCTWWRKGESSPTISLLYLKYYTEVNPVSQDSNQTPGSLFKREAGRVVEAVSESSILSQGEGRNQVQMPSASFFFIPSLPMFTPVA